MKVLGIVPVYVARGCAWRWSDGVIEPSTMQLDIYMYRTLMPIIDANVADVNALCSAKFSLVHPNLESAVLLWKAEACCKSSRLCFLPFLIDAQMLRWKEALHLLEAHLPSLDYCVCPINATSLYRGLRYTTTLFCLARYGSAESDKILHLFS